GGCLRFGFSDFEFRICFGFRYSNFGFCPPLTALPSQEYVRGFEIAVDEAGLMRVVHRAGQQFDEFGGAAAWLGRARQTLPEVAAVQVFQGEVRPARVLADFVNLHDVRVLQPGERLSLFAEALDFIRVGEDAGLDHFQSDDAVQGQLARLVDDAHAAAA